MNVRKLAVDAIDKIMNGNGYSNIVVNDNLKKFELPVEDKKLFTNFVYGTIQNILTLEYYLEPFIEKKKPKHWNKYLLLMVCFFAIVYLLCIRYPLFLIILPLILSYILLTKKENKHTIKKLLIKYFHFLLSLKLSHKKKNLFC